MLPHIILYPRKILQPLYKNYITFLKFYIRKVLISNRLTYFPISSDIYEQKIGYVSGGRFYFSFDYYADILIHDTKELEDFLINNPEYNIVDEYGHTCELKELLKMK